MNDIAIGESISPSVNVLNGTQAPAFEPEFGQATGDAMADFDDHAILKFRIETCIIGQCNGAVHDVQQIGRAHV